MYSHFGPIPEDVLFRSSALVNGFTSGQRSMILCGAMLILLSSDRWRRKLRLPSRRMHFRGVH